MEGPYIKDMDSNPQHILHVAGGILKWLLISVFIDAARLTNSVEAWATHIPNSNEVSHI